MKNKEKFMNEIANIVCDGDVVAIRKDTYEPMPCNAIKCRNCLLFNDSICLGSNALRDWAQEEYGVVISYDDSLFLNFIKDDYEYIARDKDDCLHIYFVKPKKRQNYGFWEGGTQARLNNFNVDFPMIKWTDENPWKISDLKKLKVVKNY